MRMRMQEGVGKACGRGGEGEIEKRLAGNTTRNSDTRYTPRRQKKSNEYSKGGKPNLPVYIEYERRNKRK